MEFATVLPVGSHSGVIFHVIVLLLAITCDYLRSLIAGLMGILIKEQDACQIL